MHCKIIIRCDGNTRNAWQHLENHHPNLRNKSNDSGESEQQAAASVFVPTESSSNKQLSIEAAFKKRRTDVYGPNSKRRKMIDEKIIKLIVCNFHPFHMVENQDFIELIELLDDRYTLPSRKTLMNKLLPSIYQKTDVYLRKILSEVK